MTNDTPATPRRQGAPAPGIDRTVPHSARIWNYWLGGKDNYEVDQVAGDQYAKVFPGIVDVARAQRGFLARSIVYLAAEAGIRQFLDVGTGLPTADNTHQVAQRVAPAARIVYVDNDPLVLAHARALLTSTPQGATAYIDADVREPGRILKEAARTLDLDRPVTVILSGILGHIADFGEARAIVHGLMSALPPGSYLSLNDGTNAVAPEQYGPAAAGYNGSGAIPYVLRSPGEIASFFDGLELVEPGVVSCPRWRPCPGRGGPAADVDAFGGVGRKALNPPGRWPAGGQAGS